MPNPDGLSTVTIHGKFEEPNATGTALSGSVTFTPNVDVVTFPDQNVIVGGTETATLDSNGEFTITLIATDTANQQPSGWTYSVTERLVGVRQRTYNIFLPYTVATVELADITPTSAAPTYLPVVGPQGPPGNVSSVNGHTGPSVTLTYTDVHALSDSAIISSSLIPDLSSTYITVARIGAANGVAGLNSSSLVPSTQLDLASSAPPSVGTGAVGTSTKLARQDHTHDGVDLVNAQTIGGNKTFSGTTTLGTTNITLSQSTASSGTTIRTTKVTGDSQSRFVQLAQGDMAFGSGSAATDVTLARSAVGELTVGGQLVASASAPSAIGHLTRKDYVDAGDAARVDLSSAQTIAGIKTFSSIPVLPSSNPTTDNQAARKFYVDRQGLFRAASVGALPTTGLTSGDLAKVTTSGVTRFYEWSGSAWNALVEGSPGPAWLPITLTGGWAWTGSGTDASPASRIDYQGMLHVKGLITGVAVGINTASTVGTLDPNSVSSKWCRSMCAVSVAGGWAQVRVDTAGNISIFNGPVALTAGSWIHMQLHDSTT